MSVQNSVVRSRRRLYTDKIDLYWIHFCNEILHPKKIRTKTSLEMNRSRGLLFINQQLISMWPFAFSFVYNLTQSKEIIGTKYARLYLQQRLFNTMSDSWLNARNETIVALNHPISSLCGVLYLFDMCLV